MMEPRFRLSRSTRPLGEMLVSSGYLKPEQLAQVLEAQRKQPADRRSPIGTLCVEMGFLSRERLDLILDQWGKRLRLGELLVNRGFITTTQLDRALQHQREHKGRLGEVLVEAGVLSEEALAETLAEQHDLAYVPLVGLTPQRDLARFVNAQFAAKHGVVPVGRLGHRLTVAISDPTRGEIVQDLARSTGLTIHPVMATRSEVKAFADQLYASSPEAAEMPGAHEPAAPSPLLVQKVVTRAVALGARDLHIEPEAAGGRIRIRVNGSLEEMTDVGPLEGKIPGLVRALKAMAHLDVGETGRPQEGTIAFTTDEGDFSRAVSLHVSTLPGARGEGLVVQILDRRQSSPTFEEVGLSETIRARFEAVLRRSRGVVLVAGPPGSGKRSTLRASLGVLRRPDALIMSVEDPIVFVQEGVSQTQLNPAAGDTCARHLRRLLRQHPDAILIDEFPDRDGAATAFGAGANGPLILCAIRANNATDAVTRVLDIGVDSNMLASSLVAVLAQRLVRQNCPACARAYEPPRSVVERWFRGGPPSPNAIGGSGCEKCGGTGFAGRVALAELWVPTAEESLWITERLPGPTLREQVLRRMRCLGQDALEQAMEGRTTLEEALRIVPHEDVVYTRQHGLEREKDALDAAPTRDAA